MTETKLNKDFEDFELEELEDFGEDYEDLELEELEDEEETVDHIMADHIARNKLQHLKNLRVTRVDYC